MNDRANELYEQHQQAIYKRTDRMFAVLLLAQYIGGIAAALFVSPQSWQGNESSVHIHVWAALVLGGCITSLPLFLTFFVPGHFVTRQIVAVGQMLFSGLLIHLTGGRLETHFHIFGSLAFLGFYRDWRVLITASLVVALDHWGRGAFWPESVYGITSPDSWRWIEHTWWVVFEDFFIILATIQSTREMKDIAIARAELEAQSFDKDTLLSICGHELKTPLTSLKLQSQMAVRTQITPSGDKVKAFAANINQQVDRLQRLVEDMLDISRIQIGKLTLVPEKVELGAVIEDIVNRLKSVAQKEGVEIRVHINSPITGFWDRLRLEQVITNLVSNACKYGDHKPVDIFVTSNGITAKIVVVDRGVGISPEDRTKVFQRFERVMTDPNVGGLGLGLFISKHIVEEHGGQITVESEPGNGSTFIVELPLGNVGEASVPQTTLASP